MVFGKTTSNDFVQYEQFEHTVQFDWLKMIQGVVFRVTALIVIIMVSTYLLFLMAYSLSNMDDETISGSKQIIYN